MFGERDQVFVSSNSTTVGHATFLLIFLKPTEDVNADRLCVHSVTKTLHAIENIYSLEEKKHIMERWASVTV